MRSGTRTRVGLVVESGEPRDPHHIAALIGYGAAAVNPYLMLECAEGAGEKVIASMSKSLLKIISKMGISTIRSYNGAQVFEVVGLDRGMVDRHFTGTPSRVGGIGLEGLAREALHRHSRAWPDAHGEALPDHVEDSLLPAASKELLPQGGQYQWRRDGEKHMWEPGTITGLQSVARGGGRETYKDFARRVDQENASFNLLRGLMRLRTDREAISVSEVEPVAEIVKRFTTGAMSLGSLSSEAHETLAIAMNRLGGRSNTGEGGEDPRRFAPDPNGDLRRSAIKQVASGRFGVTADYLVNADQIQIKVAQGAKPGEGGQLPGHKITAEIGRLRLSTPGVELISPPPHHDIYSIEDLKQLIYDLRCVNPRASISVKLCAEVGVGTVAAGVVKANADHIVIAGHDGGTGAASLSSIHHAGVPWEIGLAETQQTLIRNDLRSRVMLQADGQMRTGRDVVVAALLGADEVGFSTAPLVATGCVMMRVCHLNTCPVGIATQDPVLRDRFKGKPEHVVRYLLAVAEEVRELMAGLGFATFQEMVGQVEMLEADPDIDRWKAGGIDLSDLLSVPEDTEGLPRRHEDPPTPVLDDSVDHIQLLPAAARAIRDDEPVRLDREIANVHRTVGALLSGEIVRRRGPEGLPEGTIDVVFTGSAGQSFAAWLAPGVTFTVDGTVNDYAGKGLSGGVFAVRPPAAVDLRPRRERDRGQRGPVRRHRRPRVLPRPGRRALRRAQLRRLRRGRGRGRPRLRVHDRRPRAGAGPDRRELRRRHERRHRLGAGRRGHLRRALQPGDGGPGGAGARGLHRAARPAGRAPRAHGLRARREPAGRRVHLGHPPGAGHAARLPRRAPARRRRGRPPRRGSARLMADPRGFLEVHRVGMPERDPAERVRDSKEIYGLLPEPRVARAGPALHGLRRAVLQQRLPAGQPDPGLEQPGPRGPLARGPGPAARHQQLPRVHRPGVPGAV